MQIKVQSRKGMSGDRLLSIFTKRVMRKVKKVRGERYRKKKETKIKVRNAAVKREFYRARRKRTAFAS